MDDAPRRIQAIELLRILSAFGIVAYHARAPFHDVAYSGLIVFLVLSPMLEARLNWDRQRPTTLLARKLLAPWAFWMTVYGVFNYDDRQAILPNGILGILYGTSAHLWFLPFMLCVLVVIDSLKPYSAKMLFWISLILATFLIFGAPVWRPWSLTLPVPIPQWIHAAAPVLVGIALGSMNHVKNGWKALIVLLGIALLSAVYTQLPGIGIPYAIGIITVAVFALYGSKIVPETWNVRPVAECMMGVYLSHFIVLVIVSAILGRVDYLTVALTFCVTTYFVWVIRRKFPGSKLILG
jgi:hypothetical protein